MTSRGHSKNAVIRQLIAVGEMWLKPHVQGERQMRYMLMVAAMLLLGGCAAEMDGKANPAAAAGDARGVDLWTPKAGLIALVQVLKPDKFYKLANKLRPDLANRPLAGMAYFTKKQCLVWIRSDLKPAQFRHTLAHELRHCESGKFHDK